MDGTGWLVTATSEIEFNHPEKVLLVLQEFAEKREEEHLRMIAALIEASQFCDVPANRPELCRILARPGYFDMDQKLLANALVGPIESGHGLRPVKDFVIYDALKAGVPTRATGKWVFDLVRDLGGNGAHPALRSEIIPKIFREDIFQKASRLAGNANGRPRSSPFFLPDHQPEPETALAGQPVGMTPPGQIAPFDFLPPLPTPDPAGGPDQWRQTAGQPAALPNFSNSTN
jgi:hypothetical protein